MPSILSKLSLSLFFISILSVATGVVFAANPNNSWFTEDFEFDLVAGKSMDAGDIVIGRSGNTLTITINTYDGWMLAETHLHVASSLDGIPQKNGNPVPGQFDDKMEHDPVVNTYSQSFDVTGFDTAYIAIHAVVQRDVNCETEEETAWGGWCTEWTMYFPGSNWAIYIEYPLTT
jgi:hypothetical protein